MEGFVGARGVMEPEELTALSDSAMTSPPELERISDYLDWHAERTPDAEAAVLGETRLRYAALSRAVDSCARAFVASGVERGDRVAVLITPRPEYLIVFLALARIGAVWVGLNPRYQRPELAYILADAEPRLLISLAELGARDYRGDLAALVAANPCIERVITLGATAPEATRFEAFLAEGANVGEAPLSARREAVTRQDALCIVYTSGTTGKPKGVVLTHRSFVRTYTNQCRNWPVTPLRILSNLPVNHIGGLGDIGSYCLVAGGTQVFMERFDARQSLALIEAERISVWLQMVTQLQRCAALPEFDRRDLGSVQIIAWGDGTLPPPLLRRLRTRAARLTSTYGLSEACGPLTYVAPDASEEVLTRTIGRPAPEYELRLADADGVPVPAGTPGEIQVRGDFVMREYFRRPEDTAQALDPDGWLHTGDVARERADGNWEIVGRLKDMFKSGGYNVYPREIEAVIESHPAVASAAVVGVPDAEFQEVGHAFVVPGAAGDLDLSELELLCRERLAGYKMPRRFHVREALPLLENGKVDKAGLRREALETLARE